MTDLPPWDARTKVQEILEEALVRAASDIHLEPTASGYEIKLRIDGVLETVRRCDAAQGRGLVARLMVLAQLLTYRTDVPQEGRFSVIGGGGERSDAGALPLGSGPSGLADPALSRAVELRLAIMPTTHGLRGAVRLPAEMSMPHSLDDLGLGAAALGGIGRFIASDTGLLIVTGPAGSGKTTTIYAILEAIGRQAPGLSIISLEDPVERDIPGVTQIEVSPFGELTYEKALRSILRQDPQVLMLGEIRDAAVAGLAVQAALAGHRLVCTLHAGTPAGAIARLLDMGIEPYQVTSALHGVLAQRLVRKLWRGEARYRGRTAVAEFAPMTESLRRAVLARADVHEMSRVIAAAPAHQTLADAARAQVRQGVTDEAEAARVLGEAAGRL